MEYSDMHETDLMSLYGNAFARQIGLPGVDWTCTESVARMEPSEEYDESKDYSRDAEESGIRTMELREAIFEKCNEDLLACEDHEKRKYRRIATDCGTVDQIRVSGDDGARNKIQAFVLNLSAPSSVAELQYLAELSDPPALDMENVLNEEDGAWTAPRWANVGDLVFFAHGKHANSKISASKTELENNRQSYSDEEYALLDGMIEKEKIIHKNYGGKIFAVGQLTGAPAFCMDEDILEGVHFRSRLFANVENICSFKNPVNVDSCTDFLQIAMTSGITPVEGDVFDSLRSSIVRNNSIPGYLRTADATPLPLSHVNEDNWMQLSREYRRAFMYESQFRHFYVNYLLKGLSGRKRIYKECGCRKAGIGYSFIDNVIFFDGKYLPVEVKLSILIEKNIKAQVRKYCHDDFIVLDSKSRMTVHGDKVYSDRVLIVDTDSVYMYKYETDEINTLTSLDMIDDKELLERLRKTVMMELEDSGK